MRYEQLEEGLNKFLDAATFEVAEDPVYFLHHPEGQAFFYDRATADRLLDDTRKNFLNLAQLISVEHTLQHNLRESAELRALLRENANQALGDHIIEDILAGEYLPDTAYLVDILHGCNIQDDIIPADAIGRVMLTLTTVYGQALGGIQNKVRDLEIGQARCPLTRAVLTEADMQSAKLFRNTFLIAARNAVQNNPGEFNNNEATVTLRELLAQLSEEEVIAAEGALNNVLSNQDIPFPQQHIELLNQWDINANNSLIRSLTQTLGDNTNMQESSELQQQLQAHTTEGEPSVSSSAQNIAIPQGYDQHINENQVLAAGTGAALNYSQPGFLHQMVAEGAGIPDHHRLTSGGIGIAGPYQTASSLPQIPVIHPYSPPGDERIDWGIPRFSLNARLPQGTLSNLPPGAAEYLAQNNINLQNVETFVSFQNRPWQNSQLEFRPHPWVHQDAPERSVDYNRTSHLSVTFADLNSRLGPLANADVVTHHDAGEVIFSPDNMQIVGLGDHNTTEGFYSFCINRDTGHVAITFHCLLNDAHQAELERIASGGAASLDQVQAAMVGVLPQPITDSLHEFMHGRNQQAVIQPIPQHYLQEAAPAHAQASGLQFAESQDLSALQTWLTQNPSESPFRSSVQQVYQRKLGEAGQQFAESQTLSALQTWLTQNPSESPFRSSIQQVYQRRLNEVGTQEMSDSGRQFAESQDLSALQTWLTQNPSESPFRSSVQQVYQRKLGEAGQQFAESETLSALQIWLTQNPTESSFRSSVQQVYQRRLNELGQQSSVQSDINTLDSEGYAPLHRAALSDDLERTRTLLSQGANINITNSNGHHTALQIAAHRGNASIVRLLLQSGADRTLTSDSGLTAAQFASNAGHGEICNLLAPNSVTPMSSTGSSNNEPVQTPGSNPMGPSP